MILGKKQHPIEGHSYAVTTGTYVGEMFIYVEEVDGDYRFISIPKNINRSVPKDKFELGISQKIVDVIKPIPDKIYNLLKKQYLFNKKKDK